LHRHFHGTAINTNSKVFFPPFFPSATNISIIFIDVLDIRLTESWAFVDTATQKIFADIQTVFSHQKNFAEYRKLMNSLKGPAAGTFSGVL
jgi:hypothetical protein